MEQILMTLILTILRPASRSRGPPKALLHNSSSLTSALSIWSMLESGEERVREWESEQGRRSEREGKRE